MSWQFWLLMGLCAINSIRSTVEIAANPNADAATGVALTLKIYLIATVIAQALAW